MYGKLNVSKIQKRCTCGSGNSYELVPDKGLRRFLPKKTNKKKNQKTRNFSRLTGTFKNNDIPKIIFWCLTLMVKVKLYPDI